MLTILTDPVPYGRYFFSEMIKVIGRPLKNRWNPPPAWRNKRYRGHYAVTRSLMEGLQKIGVPYTYNPKRLKDVAETVIVLSGVNALRQAIRWKREGRIRRLLAGPNILVFPSEHREICAPEVDLCIINSNWTNKCYVEDCPELVGRCAVWPAGVDTNFWNPDNSNKEQKHVLIYNKLHGNELHLLSSCSEILRQRYYVINLMFGNYTSEEYKSLLQKSKLMIGFSRSESQGLAWVEAWSMDVPTLLWENSTNIISGRLVQTSTAPYLTAHTGVFFKDAKHFELIFKKFESAEFCFRPREWVLENMSDEICARQLCNLAGVVCPT